MWEVLGIARTHDERSIKRAYAVKLKVTRPDDDPVAFQLLNDCFQHALAYARQQRAEPAASPEPAVPAEPAMAVQDVVTYAPAEPRPAIRLAQPVRTVPPPVPTAPPAPAGTSAAEQARQLWATFIGTATVQPRQRLSKLSDGDALLNMEVREQFELCAARYCASDACSDELREAVVAHYGWETDHALIARQLPQETRRLLTQLRAARSYAYFQQHKNTDLAVKVLLAKRDGLHRLQTCDATFMRKMRELVAAIHTHHPEMLELKLDHARFAVWEGRVARKRYFVQTFIYSIVVGMLLWLLLLGALSRLNVGSDWSGSANVCAMAVSFGGFAWYAFKGPGAGPQWRDSALSARVQHLLYDLRYQPRWQFGWLPPFIAVATLLFVPEPGPLLRLVVAVGLVVCVLAAAFATSAIMNGVTFAIVMAAAFGLGTALNEKSLAYNVPTCSLAAFCFIMMLIRGGRDVPGMAALAPETLLKLRILWFAGVIVLIGTAHLPFAVGAPGMYAVAGWLWLCAGVLLACPSFNLIYAFIGAVMVNILAEQLSPKPSLLATPAFMHLFAGMTLVMMFMSVNMIRAHGSQHQFS